jgi:2,3-bisphosphoglycerate-independent phosphoglycerate mutase
MSFHNSPRGALSLAEGVKALYAAGQMDYSLDPLILVDDANKPLGRVKDGDAVIFCCRRGEREVELTEAFTGTTFNHFSRPEFHNLKFVIFTLYHEKFKDLPVVFTPSKIKDTLGEVVSLAGLRQLHISESEKFSHVTFFFNGGNNQPFPGEDDIRIPSPRGVPFDQVPELSLSGVVDEVLRGVGKKYDLIVTNFANGDVIGHTSNNSAKIRCVTVVDEQLGRVVQSALASDYVVFVTADHGNLELMTNPDGRPHVAHTTNPVQCLLLDSHVQSAHRILDGNLADVAPTILSALGLTQPASMTGKSLAPGYEWGGRRRVLLIILDGWGIGRDDETNPIHLAHTPNWDGLLSSSSHSQLQASGDSVGLQPGKAGNSEAGHINLGAGRVVLQDDARLDLAMRDGSFYTNEILLEVISDVKKRGTNLHLIGLLTEKSSHGSIMYPLALLQMARDKGLDNVFLHVIFDGRSTEPGSAPAMLEKLERQVDEIGIGCVVTGMGRGIALDRDGNYEKIERAFNAMVLGKGKACIRK